MPPEDADVYRTEIADALNHIAVTKMPFGKYAGMPIYNLPWEYLHWFTQNGREFPSGQIGQLLEVVYHMKSDGSDEVFEVFRQGDRQKSRRQKL